MTTMTTASDSPSAEAAGPARGSMHTLDRAGDLRVTWDPASESEVAEARRTFADLTGRGYLAYKTEGKRGSRQGEQIRSFDPAAERIVLVRPLQGG
jgi:hypothetical protein